jgi:hypothetical protein
MRDPEDMLERRVSKEMDTEGSMEGSSGGEDKFTDDMDDDTSPYTGVNNDEVLNRWLALSVGNMLVHTVAEQKLINHGHLPVQLMCSHRSYSQHIH